MPANTDDPLSEPADMIFESTSRKPRRPLRLRAKPPKHTIAQILVWADAHHERTGRWPHKTSGRVTETLQETWVGIDLALQRGSRGLPGGTTLARLLLEQRGVRNHLCLPRLTVQRILSWADAHHERTGSWPRTSSGRVFGTLQETWSAVDRALTIGYRGLPGGGSLARLLQAERGVRNRKALPALSIKEVLRWADRFFKANGHWPTRQDGPIAGAPGETWAAVDAALHNSCRGFRGGTSLARLLERKRGARNRKHLPKLTERQILRWARRHRRQTGKWPTENSGPVPGTHGEVWGNVSAALREGIRGLAGGDTLAQLLARRLGVRNVAN